MMFIMWVIFILCCYRLKHYAIVFIVYFPVSNRFNCLRTRSRWTFCVVSLSSSVKWKQKTKFIIVITKYNWEMLKTILLGYDKQLRSLSYWFTLTGIDFLLTWPNQTYIWFSEVPYCLNLASSKKSSLPLNQ